MGLTGGIGAGKSAVAELFRERGALIVDADVLAREAVAPGSDGQREIASLWPEVVDAAGRIDRPALARVVFADPAARARLEAIIHPRVRAAAEAFDRAAPDGAVVVHVVPLLFESEYGRTFPVTVAVVAPREARVARVVERDGVQPADVERRMAAQIDPETARRRATFTIENDGDVTTLRERANAVYDRLRAGRWPN